MKHLLILILLFLPTLTYAWEGRCVWVPDGDDLIIQTDEGLTRVRLWGIDAPEWGQPYSLEAAQYLAKLAQGKIVSIETKTKGRYGRTIGWVTVDGKSVSQEMLRAGLAWWFQRYAPNRTDLEDIAREARKQRRGLWKQEHPEPPWKYRR